MRCAPPRRLPDKIPADDVNDQHDERAVGNSISPDGECLAETQHSWWKPLNLGASAIEKRRGIHYVQHSERHDERRKAERGDHDSAHE